MKIGIGSDHAGCELKARLSAHLTSAGHQVVNFGTDDPDKSVDYPVYARLVAEAVSAESVDMGVLVCGTGIGMSIVANKVPGVRAALIHDVTTARLARIHNNANVIAMGGRLLAPEFAIDLVEEFMAQSFEHRHQKRLDLISDVECGG